MCMCSATQGQGGAAAAGRHYGAAEGAPPLHLLLCLLHKRLQTTLLQCDWHRAMLYSVHHCDCTSAACRHIISQAVPQMVTR